MAATSQATTLRNGGFTFAERPEVEAPDARIIWHADFDPGTLSVVAVPTARGDPNGIDPKQLEPWLATAIDRAGEHAVLSDGWHHIRLDIEQGSIAEGSPVVLHYRLSGVGSAAAKILPLRRLLELYRTRHFSASLYPPDPRVARSLMLLRVHDAVVAGASQREIAVELFGPETGATGSARSESLRSRVRRLVVDARRLAGGGYRSLMHRDRNRSKR